MTANRPDRAETILVDGSRIRGEDRDQTYKDVEVVQLNLSNEANTVTIGLPSFNSVAIQGGSAADEFLVYANHPAGEIQLHGNGGNDSFHTIGFDANERAGTLSMFGGGDDDSFYFAAGGAIGGTIDGGAGDNRLDFSEADSPVDVAITAPGMLSNHRIAGGATNIDRVVGSSAGNDRLLGPDQSARTFDWLLTGRDSGYTTNWQEHEQLIYSSFETLVGGDAYDRFRFYYAASVSGSIDGGGQARDLLSFRRFDSRVSVDLLNGTASPVAGLISNVEHVTGSVYDDTIRGDNGVNTLHGYGGNDVVLGLDGEDKLVAGEGRSILIGGTGADHLIAGLGDGHLILGGGTARDEHPNFQEIFTDASRAWTTADLSVDDRIDILHEVFGGPPIDNAFDVLRGPGASMDWLIHGQNSGELVHRATSSASPFLGIESLEGAAANDRFRFQGGHLDGSLDGGDGVDSLDYREDQREVAIEVLSPTEMNVTGVSGTAVNIDKVLGVDGYQPPGTPGDMDGDDAVDGADFLAWQRRFGIQRDQDDLNDLQASYGTSSNLSNLEPVSVDPATSATQVVDDKPSTAGQGALMAAVAARDSWFHSLAAPQETFSTRRPATEETAPIATAAFAPNTTTKNRTSEKSQASLTNDESLAGETTWLTDELLEKVFACIDSNPELSCCRVDGVAALERSGAAKGCGR